jgi:OHCU decarboxylase
MFATVAVVGFQILSRVDFHDHRNVVIVATSVGLAMYVTAQPQVAQAVPNWAEIIFGSGITLGSISAIALNVVFHHTGVGRGPAVAGQPGDSVQLGQVNDMSRKQFVETFSGLFQGPHWVVERAYDARPFSDTHALRRAFQEALFSASREEQRQLIEAYPELGSRLVADGLLGEESLKDQSARGLTRLGDTEHEELAELTDAYRERFGFPLVISVRDADSFDKILEQGRARLGNCENQEHAAALIEIAKIAGYRFDDFLSEADPIHTARSRWAAKQ